MALLNQRKGENDPRKYFMINLHKRMLLTSAGVETVRPPGLQLDGASEPPRPSFKSTGLSVQKFKIDFQDGRLGGHAHLERF